jgi:O-methyltransferase
MRGSLRTRLYGPVRKLLSSRNLELVRPIEFDPAARAEGRGWPADAETMIGLRRLDNLQECVTRVLRDGVPGDLIETGVWRGGATIFMRAVLKAYGCTDRVVWAADSFQGLPRPNADSFPADSHDRHWTWNDTLAVSLEDVKSNFARYGLLDDQVHFLPGWFRDTLPAAPIHQLAVLRLDGDMYESTFDALQFLYPKLSVGGYVIVDDYWCAPGCKPAVEDYRSQHDIKEELIRIDWSGVFWRRLR